jgi:tetratricopeptide (TPR) repeat protein
MKKLHVFLAFLLMSSMVFAQTKNLKNADSELKRGDRIRLDRAVPAIRLAMEEPENQFNPSAWFSQARIYTAVAASQNPAFRNLEPNAIQLAFESFQKAFELDQTGRIKLLSGPVEVEKLVIVTYDLGAVLYNQRKFAEAADAFIMAVNAALLIDLPKDNEIFLGAIYNAAFCANLAGNHALAKKYYQKLVDLQAAQSSVYTALAVIFKDEDDFVNAGKFADMAVELFPDDYATMINAASIHLMIENSERAAEILAVMSENYADNAIVFFAKGLALDQIGMPNEAEVAYLRAIELNPEYFDAIFNLAVHYVQRGAKIMEEADGLPTDPAGLRKYDEMKAQADGIFRKAIPMLEKALEMSPNNIPVMTTLRDIYVQLRMMDKAIELNEEIERLTQ